MPLKLTLKPNEKLIVNGAVLSNGSPRAVTLTFHNKAQLLQQKDVLLPEDATTPLLRTYFALQCMYLDHDEMETHHKQFIAYSNELFAATRNVAIRSAITSAANHVSAGEFYRALSALRAALPVEKKLLAGDDPSATHET
jgi:flagellar biosynthesis repressor protein FlbT